MQKGAGDENEFRTAKEWTRFCGAAAQLQQKKGNYFLIQFPLGVEEMNSWAGIKDTLDIENTDIVKAPLCMIDSWKGRNSRKRSKASLIFLSNAPLVREALHIQCDHQHTHREFPTVDDVKLSFEITDRLAGQILGGLEKQAVSRYSEEVHYLVCMAAAVNQEIPKTVVANCTTT